MALVIRNYGPCGPSQEDLSEYVSAANVTVVGTTPVATVQIQIEDSIQGIVTALDEYMTSKGFEYIPSPP